MTFVDRAKQLEAHSSQFFDDIHRLATLMSCSDAYMLRSDLAIFVVTTTTDRQTNYFIPAHVHGVI